MVKRYVIYAIVVHIAITNMIEKRQITLIGPMTRIQLNAQTKTVIPLPVKYIALFVSLVSLDITTSGKERVPLLLRF